MRLPACPYCGRTLSAPECPGCGAPTPEWRDPEDVRRGARGVRTERPQMLYLGEGVLPTGTVFSTGYWYRDGSGQLVRGHAACPRCGGMQMDDRDRCIDCGTTIPEPPGGW